MVYLWKRVGGLVVVTCFELGGFVGLGWCVVYLFVGYLCEFCLAVVVC